MLHCAAKFLTLLSVLFHAGVGCCAHHEHCPGLPSESQVAEKQESPKTPQCSCSFHAHCATETAEQADSSEPEHSNCPCGESHGGCTDHCSWLTNSRVELPTDDGIVLPLSMVDGFTLNASGAALTACALHAGPPLLSGLTDSLRAKTQVWRL